MKRVGILLNERDYFLPYVNWLFDNQKGMGYEIVAVHTNNKQWAEQNNIPTQLIQSFDDVIEKSDLAISLSYWNIIDEETIEKVPMGIINFHHSYRLKYRGRHSATWAIRKNEKLHGSTMHFIDKELDSGKIIDTDFFEVQKSDVAEDIFFKANDIGLNLLKKNFNNIINQQDMEYSQPSDDYFSSKGSDLNHEISLSFLNNADELLQEIKALTYGNCPAPFVNIDGNKVYLKMENYDSGVLNEKQQ